MLDLTSPEVLGTIPQWITSAGILTLLGWMAKLYLGKGRLSIDAKQVELNAEGKLRDHYGSELESLRKQIIEMGRHHLDREREIDDRWRKLLQESEERHDECVRQREELSRKVREVEQRQIGTVRQFLHFQQRLLEVLPKNLRSPALVHALESLEPFTDTPLDPEDGQ